MQNIKLVVFDMDGLLFDTETLAFKTFKEILKIFNYEFNIDLYKQMIGLRPEDDKKLLMDYYGNDFPYREIIAKYEVTFSKRVKDDGVKLKDGAITLLNLLDELEIKRCIASSSPRSVIKRYLDMHQLSDRFDFYLSGEEVENGKPHPDIFLEACSLARVKPAEAIVLEDSYNGFLSAYRADIPCIVVPDMVEPNEDMKKNAYQIYDDLNEVARFIKQKHS